MNHKLQQARIKHISYKSKVRAVVYGVGGTGDDLLSEKNCALGKWIDEIGLPEFSHFSEMKALDKLHLDLHKTVYIIVDLCKNGRNNEAHNYLTKIEEISAGINNLLERIDQRILAGE